MGCERQTLAQWRLRSVSSPPWVAHQLCLRDAVVRVVPSGPDDLEESHELGGGVPAVCEILGPDRLQLAPTIQIGRTIKVCHERLAAPNLNGDPRMTPRWDVDSLCPGWPLIHGPPADNAGS